MRIAAGILMIIGGGLGIGVLRITYGSPLGLPGWLVLGFIFTGGVCTLRKEVWKLCFISSLLLTLLLVLGLFFFPVGAIIFLLPGGILPLVFVCLSKRDWES